MQMVMVKMTTTLTWLATNQGLHLSQSKWTTTTVVNLHPLQHHLLWHPHPLHPQLDLLLLQLVQLLMLNLLQDPVS